MPAPAYESKSVSRGSETQAVDDLSHFVLGFASLQWLDLSHDGGDDLNESDGGEKKAGEKFVFGDVIADYKSIEILVKGCWFANVPLVSGQLDKLEEAI